MSDFVFNPAPVPPAAGPEAVIVNDGWFPDVDPAKVRTAINVRDGVSPARLREAILSAIISAGVDLAAWAALRTAEGRATLAAVPAPTLDGESRLVLLYHRAICAFVKAELAERYRDNDLTGDGQREVGALAGSIDDLRRDARHAIRDFLGRTRTAVELI
ncbi:MAG: head completion/stabilization protein [Sphingomonas bacterium]|nr:head completion/stabilization protein [Sphingomonas bacterium]